MSSYMNDISGILSSTGSIENKTTTKTAKKNGYDLSMEDFLKLMMVELQNQTIDDTADTGEMLNQMVQMQMVTALSNMTDASLMSYASSLVGKDVTIGTYNNGSLEETLITVIGTGTMDGSQVIFGSDGKTYQLSQVMAVGRLPEIEGSTVKDYTVSSGNKPSDTTTSTDNKTESSTSKPSTDNKTENTDKTETDNKTESSGTDAAEEGKEPADSTEVPGDRPTDSADTTGNSDSEEKADDSVQPPAEVG